MSHFECLSLILCYCVPPAAAEYPKSPNRLSPQRQWALSPRKSSLSQGFHRSCWGQKALHGLTSPCHFTLMVVICKTDTEEMFHQPQESDWIQDSSQRQPVRLHDQFQSSCGSLSLSARTLNMYISNSKVLKHQLWTEMKCRYLDVAGQNTI